MPLVLSHIQKKKRKMDVKLINCIEAIANLHYLIRISQNDPAAVASYLDRADETLEALVRHLRLGATQELPRPDDSDGVDE
jgi:hypothetical protein